MNYDTSILWYKKIRGAVLLAVLLLNWFPLSLGAQEEVSDPIQTVQTSEQDEEEEESPAPEKDPQWQSRRLLDINILHLNIFIRLGIAAAIILMQFLLIRLSIHLFEKLQVKITASGNRYLKPLTIKKYRVLETAQIMNAIYFLLRILKYVVIALQLYLTLPLIFSLFEPTKNLASTLFSYILNPLKNTGIAIINYIPNLITIVITIFIVRYAIRSLRFFTDQIEKGKLVINGFYPDWAQPTFNILRVLLYAFTVIVIYPYLPGSDSAVFQGVTVFVGIIFSLGSSSAIGNLVAGLVLTYMRPFKIGDRIKINDVIGYVVEKSATVTRLRTVKNEYVTFPNQSVLNANIINYNFSSVDKEDGLVLYVELTMGYGVPWRQVHELLIAAAEKTPYVREKPKPFVLQTALDDYYCRYQINVYTKEIGKLLVIYSNLYQNIQDVFTEAKIDLTSPAYQIHIPQDMKEAASIPSEGNHA